MRLLVPIGCVTTTRAQLPDVIATVGDDLGRWQVFGGCDPGAWVGSVHTWTEHRVALLAQRFGPELYDKRLLGATRYSRYSLLFLSYMESLFPVSRGKSGGGYREEGLSVPRKDRVCIEDGGC